MAKNNIPYEVKIDNQVVRKALKIINEGEVPLEHPSIYIQEFVENHFRTIIQDRLTVLAQGLSKSVYWQKNVDANLDELVELRRLIKLI